MNTRICTYCTNSRPAEEFHQTKAEARAMMSPPCASCRSAINRGKKHGLSVFEYLRLMRVQDHACAICKRKFDAMPLIDHCHKHGHVRGLLCTFCNSGLGFFRDDRSALTRAIEYLTRTHHGRPDRDMHKY